MFNLFRLCRKDETGNVFAKNGNNVEATFDIVERIVKLVAFDKVTWTLLLVWTGLNESADSTTSSFATFTFACRRRPDRVAFFPGRF